MLKEEQLKWLSTIRGFVSIIFLLKHIKDESSSSGPICRHSSAVCPSCLKYNGIASREIKCTLFYISLIITYLSLLAVISLHTWRKSLLCSLDTSQFKICTSSFLFYWNFSVTLLCPHQLLLTVTRNWNKIKNNNFRWGWQLKIKTTSNPIQ